MPYGKEGQRRAEPSVPHYYGDVVRILMLCATALMLLGIPFFSQSLRSLIPIEIAFSIPIVALAALTNPWKRWVIVGDVLLTAGAAVVFETAAYVSYDGNEEVAFVLYGIIGLLFLIAFYFSLKTLRAMMLHQVGKPDNLREFNKTPSEPHPLEQEETFNPNLMSD